MASVELYAFDAQFPGLHAFWMFLRLVSHDGPILEVFLLEDLAYWMVGLSAELP